MKKYERIILKIDDLVHKKSNLFLKKTIVVNLQEMLHSGLNKPYRGDYYDYPKTENKNSS